MYKACGASLVNIDIDFTGGRMPGSVSEEERKAMSERMKGFKPSPEHAEKLRLAHVGKIESNLTRMRKSEALKAYTEATGGNMLGKNHAIETKLKMSTSALKLPLSIILGVIFDEETSRKKLSLKYGISENEVKCIRGARNYRILKYHLGMQTL